MHYRRIVLALAGLMLPAGLMAVVANQGPAGAGPVYFPIACSMTGTVSFTPPLSGVGSSNTSPVNESTSVSASLGACLSSNPVDAGTTTGVVSFTVATAPIKVKVGRVTKYSTGQCGVFVDLGRSFSKGLHGKAISATWSNQGAGALGGTIATVKSTAAAFNSELTGDEGVRIVTTFVSGDYLVKTGAVDMFLTDGLTQIFSCALGAPGTIASLNIDQRVSTFVG